MKNFIPEHIEKLEAYVPGRLIEEVAAEMGLSRIIKLASNENNLGPSPKAVKAISSALGGLARYGDADGRALKKAIFQKFGFDPQSLMVGNGSSEFILVMAHALLGPGTSTVMSRPSFTLYAKNAQASGAEVREVPLKNFGHDLDGILARVDSSTRLIFLDNPLNPTGAYLLPGEVENFLNALPANCLLVLDEAYVDFTRKPKPDYLRLLAQYKNFAVMRTFSKIYGLAGLRSAYMALNPSLAATLNKVRQPFNMNSLAQLAAIAALDDYDYLEATLNMVWEGLDYYYEELPLLGLVPHPSEANFLMVGLGAPKADEIFKALMKEGVIVRSLSSFALNDHLRITCGLPDENQALLAALKKVL